MKIYHSPKQVIESAGRILLGANAYEIESPNWQGLGNPQKMIEVLGSSFKCPMPHTRSILAIQTYADLPWAEDHFQERIAGDPTNPGKTYKDWPYYKEDDYRKGGKFSHTYQERFWPKRANGGQKTLTHAFDRGGIRYNLGDYNDLIELLVREPETRQAYLPIFFPEDTGAVEGQRIPCTLGYLFNYRRGYLHLTYYIRSCDYIRHFKNDVYMAIRLAQNTLECLRKTDLSPINWGEVQLGLFTMHVESLHCFQSDIYELKKRLR